MRGSLSPSPHTSAASPPAVRARDRLFRASDISGLGGNCRLTTIFIDDDFGYPSAFDQKNDLPYISISIVDKISRIMFADEPAVGVAEYVHDPSPASSQIFILIFEERAGHFGPCGFSGGSIVAFSGSFESFGVQRMPSPSLANLFSTHEFPKRVRWVPEPSDPNRQREKQDQHDSRHDGGRIFHYLSRDPDHGCPHVPLPRLNPRGETYRRRRLLHEYPPALGAAPSNDARAATLVSPSRPRPPPGSPPEPSRSPEAGRWPRSGSR